MSLRTDSLTSAQTAGVLLARSNPVNPGKSTIWRSELTSRSTQFCIGKSAKRIRKWPELLGKSHPGMPNNGHRRERRTAAARNSGITRMNDNNNPERPVTIITGRVRRDKTGEFEGVHVMLVAPDDDSAVRTVLEALAKEGYAEAELDQVGDMHGAPDEEPHASAYQGAVEGEVSIVTFKEMF
jgi:hypothetical protein